MEHTGFCWEWSILFRSSRRLHFANFVIALFITEEVTYKEFAWKNLLEN